MKRSVLSNCVFLTLLINTNVILSLYTPVYRSPYSGYYAQTETCNICLEDRNRNDFEALSCGHRYCRGCVTASLNQAAEERNIERTTCLRGECAQKYSHTRIRDLIGQERYLRFFPQPTAPYTLPTSLQERAWLDLYTEQCTNPRCRRPIQKNDGCNHMTCRREALGCGNEFCWLCLGPYHGHDAAICGQVSALRQQKDAEIARRASGAAPILTDLERQAQAAAAANPVTLPPVTPAQPPVNRAPAAPPVVFNYRPHNPTAPDVIADPVAQDPNNRNNPFRLNAVREQQLRRVVLALAIAGISYALYRYLNNDNEDNIKAKKKNNKSKNALKNNANEVEVS